MSQVATIRKVDIRNERVNVTAHFHEQGSVMKGDKAGYCDGFEVEIRLDSEAPAEEVATLIRLAHRMCFTEAAMLSPVPVTTRHTLNGQPFEVDLGKGSETESS